jgi:hypothetical protein
LCVFLQLLRQNSLNRRYFRHFQLHRPVDSALLDWRRAAWLDHVGADSDRLFRRNDLGHIEAVAPALKLMSSIPSKSFCTWQRR